MRGQCVGTKITLAANCRRVPVGDEIIIDIARGEVFRWGKSVRLAPTPMRILIVFAMVRDRILMADDIAEALWVDDLRGGPDSYLTVVGRQLHRTRYAIAPLGLIIASHLGWRKYLIVVDHPASDSEIQALLLKSMRRKVVLAA